MTWQTNLPASALFARKVAQIIVMVIKTLSFLQRAFEYFNQAANAGNSHAMAFLGKVRYKYSQK